MNTNLQPDNLITEPEHSIRFKDLFDLDEIQHLQDLFADAHGVASIITHPDGSPITRPSNFTRLCSDIIRKTDMGCQNCIMSDVAIGLHNPDGPIVQRCLSGGFWDASASITVGNKHIANWLIGQVRNEGVDEEQVMGYADEMKAKREEFLEALLEIPVMSEEKFNKVAKMLFVYANQLSEKAHTNLLLKTQIAECERVMRQLHENEKNYLLIFENLHEVFYRTDLNGTILDISPSIKYFAEFNENELIGTLVQNLYSNMDDRQDLLNTLYRDGELQDFELTLKTKTGKLKHASVNVHLVLDSDGRPIQMAGSIRDITQQRKVEEELIESENKYREMVENLPDAIAIYANGRIVYSNEECHRLLAAKSAEDMVGKSVMDFVHPDFRALVIERMKNVSIPGTVLPMVEEKFIRMNGTEVDVEVKAISIQFENKPAVQMIVRDVSERKQAINALRNSEEKYRNLFANNPHPLWIYDIETLAFMDVNEAAIEHYGYSKEEFLSMTIKDIRPVEDIPLLIEDVTLTSNKYNNAGEWRHLKKNGEIIFVEITSHLLLYNGKPTRQVSVKDITSTRRAQEDLLKSEEKYRRLHESMIDGYVYVNLKGFITDYNESYKRMLGFTEEELLTIGFKDFTPEKWHGFEQQIISEQILVRGYSDIYEKEYQRKDGTIFPVEVHAFLIKNDAGDNEGMWAIVRDITERKRTEKELMNSHQKLLDIIDFLPDATFVIDNEKKVIAWNKAIEKMTGVPKQEMIGKGDHQYAIPFYGKTQNLFLDLIDNNDEELGASYSNFWREGLLLHAEIFAPALSDGKGAFLSVLGAPLFNSNGTREGSIESIRDITGRVKDNKVLRTLSLAINQSKEVVFITDLDGIIDFINPEFTRIYGYSSDEVVGKVTPRILKSEYYIPENYEYFWKTLLSKISIKDEYTNKRKDGSIINIEGSADPILDFNGDIIGFLGIQRDITDRKQAEVRQLKNEKALLDAQQIAQIGSWEYDIANDKPTWSNQMFELFGLNPDDGEPSWEKHRSIIHPDDWTKLDAAVKSAVTEGIPYNIEFRILHPTEGSIWACTVGKPDYDNKGKLVRLKGTTQNINDRKLIEEQLKTAKEKAEESDHLKSAFLANMSHEIRTPLNGIIGFSELLNDPDFDLDQKSQFIKTISECGNNLIHIVSDIMDLSMMETGQIIIRKEPFSVRKLLADLENEFKIKASDKEIEFKVNISFDFDDIILNNDIFRIKQVLNNFLNNALKFTSIGFIEIGYFRKGNSIDLYVKDTGIGIPLKFHQTIFERFRQIDITKTRKYGGNGLGLAISKKLAEILDGEIWIESEPDKGSTFHFTVPIKNIGLSAYTNKDIHFIKLKTKSNT